MATRLSQLPETVQGPNGQQYDTHPAFGMVQASRTSGSGVGSASGSVQFGVKHPHYNTVTITLTGGVLYQHDGLRGGCDSDHRCLVSLTLTQSQWLEFISVGMNTGKGVPCTITRLPEGDIPSIQKPETVPPCGFAESIRGSHEQALKLLESIKAELGLDTAVGVTRRRAMIQQLEQAARRISDDVNFVVKQFGDHKERQDVATRIDTQPLHVSAPETPDDQGYFELDIDDWVFPMLQAWVKFQSTWTPEGVAPKPSAVTVEITEERLTLRGSLPLIRELERFAAAFQFTYREARQ